MNDVWTSPAGISALTALVAVVVGPILSLYLGRKQQAVTLDIAARQISASVVSASRQQWIDRVRDTIAEYMSAVSQLGFQGGISYERKDDALRHEKVMLLQNRIVLLLDPNEPDHQALIAMMSQVMIRAYEAGPESWRALTNTLREMTVLSQQIFKREWERVKAGEPIVQSNALRKLPTSSGNDANN